VRETRDNNRRVDETGQERGNERREDRKEGRKEGTEERTGPGICGRWRWRDVRKG
jgi:hypothetical protein